MEEEGIEQQILLQPEFAVVGAVYSVNGYTGHVVLKTSDLENDSGYQTAAEIVSAINEHNENELAHPYLQTLIGTKQDELTPGANINISSDNVISATDTTYSAGNGININGEKSISVDTTIVATQQNLANEVTNRENADNALQAQIDGISASSDVVDIVGTYAELQQYDTQHLKDNDIIKVLQDETQGGATTYYRWSTTTNTFTLIGQEGPYYTKAAADSQFVPQTRTVNGKALSSNITLNASDVSALGTSDVVQTTGSSTSQVMSQNAVTTQLNTKLDASDYVVDTQLADSTNPVQNRVINNLLGDMPSDFFTAGETVSDEGTDITLNNTISAPVESIELDGDTYQQTYSGKNKIELTDGGVHGITGINNNDGTITISGTADTTGGHGVMAVYNTIEAGTYTLCLSKTLPFLVNLSISGGVAFRIPSGSRAATTTLTQSYSGGNLFMSMESGTTYNETFGIQLVEGSEPDYDFEPYVGGISSPNPDYPQDVQVVTGEQTVTISDDDNQSQSYTISLGSIELCKIGDYQDYIYKSGDDWYVHKEIGRQIVDVSTITLRGNYSNVEYGVFAKPNDYGGSGSFGYNYPIVSTHAIFKNNPPSWDSANNIGGGYTGAATTSCWIGFAKGTGIDNIKSALSGLTNYYALATTTDTKITDATLIGQLEALYKAKTYLGTTSIMTTATGTNLPVILDIVAYRKSLAGMLGAIERLSE